MLDEAGTIFYGVVTDFFFFFFGFSLPYFAQDAQAG